MAANLVDLASKHLGDGTLARLATQLGIDGDAARKFVSGAIPALIGAISAAASKPGGASRIADLLKNTDPSVMSEFDERLSVSEKGALVSRGARSLSSILDSGSLGSLEDNLSRFAGVKSKTATVILGALAPIVLGTIKKNASNMSADSILNLLESQSDFVRNAVPSGLRSSLTQSGLLDSAAGAAGKATQAAQWAIPPGSTGSGRWIGWAVAAIAIAAVVWFAFGRGGEDGPDQVSKTAEQVGQSLQQVVVDGVNLTETATGVITSLQDTLGSVTDGDTAQAAMQKLSQVSGDIDALSGRIAELGSEQKAMLAGVISAALPAIDKLIEKVTAIPGVGEELKPTLEALRAKLDTLTAV